MSAKSDNLRLRRVGVDEIRQHLSQGATLELTVDGQVVEVGGPVWAALTDREALIRKVDRLEAALNVTGETKIA